MHGGDGAMLLGGQHGVVLYQGESGLSCGGRGGGAGTRR